MAQRLAASLLMCFALPSLANAKPYAPPVSHGGRYEPRGYVRPKGSPIGRTAIIQTINEQEQQRAWVRAGRLRRRTRRARIGSSWAIRSGITRTRSSTRLRPGRRRRATPAGHRGTALAGERKRYRPRASSSRLRSTIRLRRLCPRRLARTKWRRRHAARGASRPTSTAPPFTTTSG